MKTCFHRELARHLGIPLLALSLAMASGTALAQRHGDGPSVHARASLIEAGDTTKVAGRGFQPGQVVTMTAEGEALNMGKLVADQDGRIQGRIQLPADADLGPFAVTVHADDAAPFTFDVKISRELPLAGADQFDIASHQLVPGLYQAAWSDDSDAVYVTSALGHAPVHQSLLLKVDPESLKIEARTTPPEVPSKDEDKGVYAVYGVTVDDDHDTVWVTNTQQSTTAVFDQDDLSLVKQFPVGTASHARDVAVDTRHDKAYVSALGGGSLAVFSTDSLKKVATITLPDGNKGKDFMPASLAINVEGGKLYVPNLGAPQVAIIDTATDSVAKVIDLPGASRVIGIGWDADDQYILATSMGTDSLLVIDPATGKVVHDVYVGAGSLNVAWEPESGLAFVSNRGAGTIAVVDPATGELVANLDGGSFPNHVIADDDGHVFAINKAHGKDDPEGNRITRIELDMD